MSRLLKSLKSRTAGPTYRHQIILADDRLLTQRTEYVEELEDLQYVPPEEGKPAQRYSQKGTAPKNGKRVEELENLISELEKSIAEETYEVVFRALPASEYDKLVEETSHFEDELPEDAPEEVRKKARGKDYDAVALELAKKSFIELTHNGDNTGDSAEDWEQALELLPPSEKSTILSQMFVLHMKRVDVPKSLRSSVPSQ